MQLYAQQQAAISGLDAADTHFEKIGRGQCAISDSVLITRGAYAAFGEHSWTDYEFSFKARVPKNAPEVQICAGFRAADRDDRYFFMLRGGIQKNLYLARLGYMGSDDFLALRELDFKPLPGVWYKFRVQVAGSRIRIFLNDEKLPRIDVTDAYSKFAPAGKITLGGSWIGNAFAGLSIKPLAAETLAALPVKEYAPPSVDKKLLRKRERAAYRPVMVGALNGSRTEVSLDGNWLFKPGYETLDDAKAASPHAGDQDWHIMHVPDFWNPIRVWLHGERYNTASSGASDNYYQKETHRCESYTFDYKRTNSAWYRQWIELPAAIAGKHLELDFDAIARVSEVWINGQKAGGRIGMFGPLAVDATSLLKPGKNLVAVKVTRNYVKDIKDPDKITGVAVTVEVTERMVKDLAHGFFKEDPAGIWQPVKLVITDPLRITDVFIKPGLTGAGLELTVKNNHPQARSFSVTTAISGFRTTEILCKDKRLLQGTLQPGEERTFTARIDDLQPKLWSPAHPNLYQFTFRLLDTAGRRVIDTKLIRSGFRTFTVRKGLLTLNGKPYWLRGGDQTAMPLAPNDSALAESFCRIMKAGNLEVTRTHTVPYTETWLNASDVNGIGVSYEGTWPWLFLESSMPDKKLVGLWRDEFLDLLKKYRNHPSLLIWTVNNEMKFYENDPDLARAEQKMIIISDVVKAMRAVDPTRPVVFDSYYHRDTTRFGGNFYRTHAIDDGDIDDTHGYYNWYDGSVFDQFNGKWQQQYKNEGRPLISQEMSTGYTDETGHPVRLYSYMHQNPEALAGKFVYEYNDPKYFLTAQAFITKELAEALRRSDDKASGVLHFSAVTWFRNPYEAKNIQPFPVYYGMKKALQPVLVSAELWGRHFYAGDTMAIRVCIVNDQENGETLKPGRLTWRLSGENGRLLASDSMATPPVAYYGRHWIKPHIVVPTALPGAMTPGELSLSLTVDGTLVSENDYDLTFASKQAAGAGRLAGKRILVADLDGRISPALDFLGIRYQCAGLRDAIARHPDVLILSGAGSLDTSAQDIGSLRSFIGRGGHVLWSSPGKLAHRLYPQYIRSVIEEKGEVANMEIPESSVFDGLEPLDIRNFNDNRTALPSVMSGAFRVSRAPELQLLASFTATHGYLAGNMDQRMAELDKIKGFPLVELHQGGKAILSGMLLDKAATDPVAGRLLVNLLFELCR